MTSYDYDDVSAEPDLTAIQDSITASAMADKSFDYCVWHEGNAELHVCMTNDLVAGDITILGGIVSSYQD